LPLLDSLSGLLTALKAATPPILIGIALACGVLLFAPPEFNDKIGLGQFVTANKAPIGAVFLGSSCVLLAQLIWWARQYLIWPLRAWQLGQNHRSLLRELTPDERAYLVRYITEHKNTQYFRIDDGIAQGLVAKQIIYQSASVGYMEDGWAYNLQPWARRLLSKEPSLLNGAGELPEVLLGGRSGW
jgi:hypothetical protein